LVNSEPELLATHDPGIASPITGPLSFDQAGFSGIKLDVIQDLPGFWANNPIGDKWRVVTLELPYRRFGNRTKLSINFIVFKAELPLHFFDQKTRVTSTASA
jgi:hypothetical protein